MDLRWSIEYTRGKWAPLSSRSEAQLDLLLVALSGRSVEEVQRDGVRARLAIGNGGEVYTKDGGFSFFFRDAKGTIHRLWKRQHVSDGAVCINGCSEQAPVLVCAQDTEHFALQPDSPGLLPGLRLL